MTKDKLFHKTYASELLLIARGDWETASILAAHSSKGRKENVCFAAQQAIEKTLKSVLCAAGSPIPLTHSIELLLDRLGPQRQPPRADVLVELTDFATVRTYQEGSEILTDEDLAETIRCAEDVLVWGEQIVSQLLAR